MPIRYPRYCMKIDTRDDSENPRQGKVEERRGEERKRRGEGGREWHRERVVARETNMDRA